MNEIGLTHISLSVDDIPATCALVEQYGGEVLADTDIGGGHLRARSRRSAHRAAADGLRRARRHRGLMELGLRDRVAIVTGASRGIGRQIALDFAREGTHLVLNARTEPALETTAHEAAAHGVRGRAGRRRPVRARRRAACRAAGGGRARAARHPGEQRRRRRRPGPAAEAHRRRLAHGFELNFFSSVRMTTRLPADDARARWGRIVSLSSTYGVEPGPLLRPVLGGQGGAAQLLQEPLHGVLRPGRARQLRDPRHHHHRGDQRHRGGGGGRRRAPPPTT